MLPLLREMFPGKLMLTVEDVARVLERTGTGGYEQTREQLANGIIVPGLRKMNRPPFSRHLRAVHYGNDGGGYERQAL